MGNLDGVTEGRDSLVVAPEFFSIQNKRPKRLEHDPAQAIAVAEQFGVGRDDGSLEYIVQIWATERPDEAMLWIERQLPGERTAQLRARIQQVRSR